LLDLGLQITFNFFLLRTRLCIIGRHIAAHEQAEAQQCCNDECFFTSPKSHDVFQQKEVVEGAL